MAHTTMPYTLVQRFQPGVDPKEIPLRSYTGLDGAYFIPVTIHDAITYHVLPTIRPSQDESISTPSTTDNSISAYSRLSPFPVPCSRDDTLADRFFARTRLACDNLASMIQASPSEERQRLEREEEEHVAKAVISSMAAEIEMANSHSVRESSQLAPVQQHLIAMVNLHLRFLRYHLHLDETDEIVWRDAPTDRADKKPTTISDGAAYLDRELVALWEGKGEQFNPVLREVADTFDRGFQVQKIAGHVVLKGCSVGVAARKLIIQVS